MATKDNTVPVDLKFLDLFYKARYPNESKRHYKQCRDQVRCGEIQIETMQENVIAELNPYIQKDSTDGRDFTDGSDSKKVTGCFRNNNVKKGHWTLSYQVRNVGTKVGGLRIVAYNPYTDNFHYFAIPKSAYAHLSNTLEIIIERYVGRRKVTATGERNCECKWFAYEVNSLEEMALFKF